MQFFLHKYPEVQKTVCDRVLALCRDDIPAFFQCGCSFLWYFHYLVLMAYCTCVMHFNAVYIEYRIIVVAEFQIDIMPGKVLVQVECPPDPYGRSGPVCLCNRLAVDSTESALCLFPGGVVEVR